MELTKGKKTLLLIVGIVIFISIASSIVMFETMTQSELNALNCSQLDLSKNFLKNGDDSIKYACGVTKCCVYGNFTEVSKVGDEYTSDFKTRDICFNKKKYSDLIDEIGLEATAVNLEEYLQLQYSRIEKNYKRQIEGWQTHNVVGLFDEISLVD